MPMRPLDQEERDGMRQRLGPEAIRRLDSLVCAGYVVHACGGEPTERPDHLVELAEYIRSGETS